MNEEEEAAEDHLETASNASSTSGEGPPTPTAVGESVRNPVEEQTPHRATLSDPGDDSSRESDAVVSSVEEPEPEPAAAEEESPSTDTSRTAHTPTTRHSDSPSSDEEPKGGFFSLLCCGKSKQKKRTTARSNPERPTTAASPTPTPPDSDSENKGCLSGLLCCGKKPQKKKRRTRHGPDRDLPEHSDVNTDDEGTLLQPAEAVVHNTSRSLPPLTFCGKEVGILSLVDPKIHFINSQTCPGRALVHHSAEIWKDQNTLIVIPEKTVSVFLYNLKEGTPRMYQISPNINIPSAQLAKDFATEVTVPRLVSLRTLSVTKFIRFSDCLDKDTFVFIPSWKGEPDTTGTVIKRSAKQINLNGDALTVTADTKLCGKWLEGLFAIPLSWETVSHEQDYREITEQDDEYKFEEVSFRSEKIRVPVKKSIDPESNLTSKTSILLSLSILLEKSIGDLQLSKGIVKLKPTMILSPHTGKKHAFLPKIKREELAEAFNLPVDAIRLSTTVPRTVAQCGISTTINFKFSDNASVCIVILAGSSHDQNLTIACRKAGIQPAIPYLKCSCQLIWGEVISLEGNKSVDIYPLEKKIAVQVGSEICELVVPFGSCGWGSLPKSFQKSFEDGDPNAEDIRRLLSHDKNFTELPETLRFCYPIKRVGYQINNDTSISGYVNIHHGWDQERVQSQISKTGVDFFLSDPIDYNNITSTSVINVKTPKFVTIVAGPQVHLVRVTPSQSVKSSTAKILFADMDKLIFSRTHPTSESDVSDTSWDVLEGGEHFLVTLKKN